MLAAFLAVFLLPQVPPDHELTYLPLREDRKETLPVDVNGDGRIDLLHLFVDHDAEPVARGLQLHLQKEDRTFAATPDVEQLLPSETAAVCVGDYLPGSGVEILLAAPDGIYALAWEGTSFPTRPQKILHLRTLFDQPSPEELPLWWAPRDLDANGLPDLFVPLPDGWRIYFQTEPGHFGARSDPEAGLTDPAERSLRTLRRVIAQGFNDEPTQCEIRAPAPLVADVDGDGRLDLIAIDRELFTVFFQKEPRVYSSARGARVRFPVAALREEEAKDTIRLSRVFLTDIDGDGLADLAVSRIEGTVGLLESIQTRILIHRGTGRGNFIPDSVIKIDGISIDPVFQDLNNDGRADCLVSRLRTDLLGQAVKSLVLGDVAITYEVFQFEPQTGRYVETPVYAYDLLVTKEELSKGGSSSLPQLYVTGDTSGDGRPDLALLTAKTLELELRKGVASAFASRRFISYEKGAFWKTKLPRTIRDLESTDLNGDGSADLLLLHDSAVGVVLSKKK